MLQVFNDVVDSLFRLAAYLVVGVVLFTFREAIDARPFVYNKATEPIGVQEFNEIIWPQSSRRSIQ